MGHAIACKRLRHAIFGKDRDIATDRVYQAVRIIKTDPMGLKHQSIILVGLGKRFEYKQAKKFLRKDH